MRAARPFCAVSRTSSSARTPASQLWSSAGLGRLECLAQVIWHLLPALGRHVIGPVEGHGWTLSMTALPPAVPGAGQKETKSVIKMTTVGDPATTVNSA